MTYSEIQVFIESWEKGGYPHQRLGQAFCNQFNLKDNVLFYSENIKDAKNMIWGNYWNGK